ncbi:unnamed protein product [Cercospora beticola]|nr:unnamed protein product [Cercospora beticola]
MFEQTVGGSCYRHILTKHAQASAQPNNSQRIRDRLTHRDAIVVPLVCPLSRPLPSISRRWTYPVVVLPTLIETSTLELLATGLCALCDQMETFLADLRHAELSEICH